MLSTVRLNFLTRCPPSLSNCSRPSRPTCVARKPHSRNPFQRQINHYSRPTARLYASNTFEEGDRDLEEDAFGYFQRKTLIERVQEVPTQKPRVSKKDSVVATSKVTTNTVPKTKIEIMEKTITKEDAGSRVDRYISRIFPKLPNSRINKLLRDKKIVVSHPGGEGFRKVEGNDRLQLGSIVRLKGAIDRLTLPPESRPVLLSLPKEKVEEVRSWILHKDESIIVLNKPANIAVQGGTGIRESIDDLCTALQFTKPSPPRLVHRLDQGASGILVLARDRPTAQTLTRKFASHDINKLYWAVCIGVPKRLAGSVKVGLKKQRLAGEDSERVFVVEGSSGSEGDSPLDAYQKDEEVKHSHSRYHTIAHTHKTMSLLALRPRTGRTHQLRVHCAQVLGTPIFGDYKYGSGCPDSLRELLKQDERRDGTLKKPTISERHSATDGVHLHLHAREIAFNHPETGKPVHFVAPVPNHMLTTMRHFDYHILADSSPHATLSPEEKDLQPYEFKFKEGKLKQKLRLNKLKRSPAWQKEKRRDHAVREKLDLAPKSSRARLSSEKKQGTLSLKSFKAKKTTANKGCRTSTHSSPRGARSSKGTRR